MSLMIKAGARFVRTVPRPELGESAGELRVCLECSDHLETGQAPLRHTPAGVDDYMSRVDAVRRHWWRLCVIVHETRPAEYAEQCGLCGEFAEDYLWHVVGIRCDGAALEDYERTLLHRNDLEGLRQLWGRRERQRAGIARNDLRALADSLQSGRVVRVSV